MARDLQTVLPSAQPTYMARSYEEDEGAGKPDPKKRAACGCVGCSCCIALVAVISASAGGWNLVMSAGTEMSKCHAFHDHPDGKDTFKDVCVHGGTEKAFSGIYDKHYNESGGGVYRCACCGAILFPSSTKFDSGTGWPSYSAPVHGEPIGYSTHVQGFALGTEVHCSTCGAHLGHVFDDGHGETGYRYCINSVCLTYDAGITLSADTDVPWVPNDYLLLALSLGGLVGLATSCCMFPWAACYRRCNGGLQQQAAPKIMGLP
mmetsp:Transcript_19676/g.45893  ORF Transcript_19676/g.45893 Transcript_19676/m.45893 type:complete len:262 (+) Transcript_19676:24-809(+)